MENILSPKKQAVSGKKHIIVPRWCGRFIPGSLKQIFWNLCLICLGSVLVAVAINGILVPHQFVSGGFMGVALVIHYLFPSSLLSLLYFLLNVPVFILGWRFVGRRFFFYSIVGMLIFSAAIALIHVPMPVHDNILSALLAGIITGIGTGIILRSNGSSGGTDILSVILANSFSIRIGTTVLAFNVIVLSAASLLFSLEAALYTLIYIFVSSQIMNIVLTGLSQRKALFIISPKWREISREVLDKVGRGVTLIQGKGGYSGQDEKILYTVITLRELHLIKEIIRQVDTNAFVVVYNTLEVMGHRIGNQPHW
ncbi:MAG: YitT family protein [Deltaproteobacteria bacterium]|nr:YitT family protein [Deltaproteobacteria bacterium]MBW2331927.1 YitT family protein [Deltaproteobacteria bacterium]MCD6266640.1 YitT family protein [Deltaproteobacteria bacterium]RLB25651.1 MAG: YitT family protein [Deltaproteobacteria bacterium]HDH87508.1 YitT family protein [Desulfobacteraceae bacterium]